MNPLLEDRSTNTQYGRYSGSAGYIVYAISKAIHQVFLAELLHTVTVLSNAYYTRGEKSCVHYQFKNGAPVYELDLPNFWCITKVPMV